MNKYRCFWLTRTDRARERVSVQGPSPKKCPNPPFYHTAVAYGPERTVADIQTVGRFEVQDPTHCAGCGYPFVKSDAHHRDLVLIFEGIKPDGTSWRGNLDEAPIGAMFNDAELSRHGPDEVGPDGRCLFVRTPAGWWPLDHKADGQRFKREGDVPTITVEGDVTVPNSYGNWSGSLVLGVLVTASGGPQAAVAH